MKRILFTLLAAVALYTVARAQETDSVKPHAQAKTLVAFFSVTGNTEQVAKELAAVLDADLHRIQPETPYTLADLNWRDTKSRSSIELRDPKSRPAITKKLENLESYDVIYLGFPLWWNAAPPIIRTFMESYKLAGKTIIPFATSRSSSIQRAETLLLKDYPDVNWKEGRRLNDISQKELQEWTEGIK